MTFLRYIWTFTLQPTTPLFTAILVTGNPVGFPNLSLELGLLLLSKIVLFLAPGYGSPLSPLLRPSSRSRFPSACMIPTQ